MREEEKQSSSQSKWKQLTKKRWFYPAVYLASAALILTSVLWMQDNALEEAQDGQNEEFTLDSEMFGEDAVEVAAPNEQFIMPAAKETKVVVAKAFYDVNADPEAQEEALVMHNNKFSPNTGIDLSAENGESFDVVASLSGTVVAVRNDSLLGNIVEIDHGEGVETYYHSLQDTEVQEGDTVKQGDVIGTAGQSEYNQESGVHVHFEVRKDGEAVNPQDVMDKELASLLEESEQDQAEDAQASHNKDEKNKDDRDAGNKEGDTEPPATTDPVIDEGKGEEQPPADDQKDREDDQNGQDDTTETEPQA
ncbi:M23 family metallopeptidase [Aureibacillus halotolerans]|uniref:Stage II sporulation protein Q n=1 Tax=Aureibacillus halotolerans TaxID=1508390 RepID=A0A4R6TYP7_9BACI|nr:M23 family metallopeptidase [Aureibacillus halotolerans]TDQ38721.1 stage II sporulation protein Q [Aureibacillus halotolerans]